MAEWLKETAVQGLGVSSVAELQGLFLNAASLSVFY